MRVAVPFTADRLRGETIDAVLAAGKHAGALVREVTFWDVSGSDTAYLETLALLWADEEDFVIVEHDVVPDLTAFLELGVCTSPYCCFPYAWTTCVGPALGCTRFRRELLRTVPDAVEQAARIPSAYGRPGHWRQLDVHLMRNVLRDTHAWQPHVHLPPVEHLNEAQQLQPDASRVPVLEVRGL